MQIGLLGECGFHVAALLVRDVDLLAPLTDALLRLLRRLALRGEGDFAWRRHSDASATGRRSVDLPGVRARAPEPVLHLGSHLGVHAVRVEAKHLSRRRGFAHTLQRVVRHRDDVIDLVDEHGHLAIHAWLE